MTGPEHRRRAGVLGAALLLTAAGTGGCSTSTDASSSQLPSSTGTATDGLPNGPTPTNPATNTPTPPVSPDIGPGGVTDAPSGGSGPPAAGDQRPSSTSAPTDPPPSDPGRTPPGSPGCALAPDLPAQSRTLFGTSVSTTSKLLHDSLADEEARFGEMSVIRTFDPHLPPADAWSRRKSAIDSKMLVTSFRMPPQEVLAGRYDAGLRDYFRNAPTDPLILWSYIHEPEPLINSGEFTAAQYRAAFRHVVELAGEQCRVNLFPTMILTGWTADPASKRNWRDYYAGADYVSVVAWDPYNSATSQPTKYDTPHNLYHHVARASAASGKPWGIAETGSVRVKGDEQGTRRGQWLERIGAWFSAQGATFVTYFQSTRDGEFWLSDSPSITAWKRWVRWSHQ